MMILLILVLSIGLEAPWEQGPLCGLFDYDISSLPTVSLVPRIVGAHKRFVKELCAQDLLTCLTLDVVFISLPPTCLTLGREYACHS